jgi:hypothetical protein
MQAPEGIDLRLRSSSQPHASQQLDFIIHRPALGDGTVPVQIDSIVLSGFPIILKVGLFFFIVSRKGI